MADIELSTLGPVIKTAYEEQPDTNAFTDAEKLKLDNMTDETFSGDYNDLTNTPDLFSGNFSDLAGTPDFIEESRIGTNNGVAPLDAAGLVPLQHLNVSGLQFKGAWNPNTNTPTIIDGTGTLGDFYKASEAGTFNAGNGSHTYAVGDWVIYAGGTWTRLGSADTVSMVNGKLGSVVLTAADVGALPATYSPPAATWATVSGKPELVNTVNGSSGAVTLTAASVGALPATYVPTWGEVTGKPVQRGTIGHAVPAVFARLGANYNVTSSTEQKIPFTTISYDIFNLHDGSGGFTVPSWARYARATSQLLWAANATGERQGRMSVNGSSVAGANMVRLAGANILQTILIHTAIVPVTPGQVLSITAWQNSGATIAVQTNNSTWFQLEFYE